MSNSESDGINKVKNILIDYSKNSKCEILYIAAGKYRISLTGKDFKSIKTDINSVIENIEKSAKKQNCEFSLQK